MNTYQYSVDTLKKAAFHDELQNVLKVLEFETPGQIDENVVVVMEYLAKRLKEIESRYKN
jgi:hypothetical protein